jgi:hypothetical protein
MEYINKKEFYIEMILSKAKGTLSEKAKSMIYLISENAIEKLRWRFKSNDDLLDSKQTAICVMLDKWHNFDPDKYDDPFSYFTEIFKRGAAFGINEIYKKKGDPQNLIKTISINGANEGDGMQNF